MKKPTVSLCMIVKDEEEFITSCLESVQHLVDELIVVDTGSSDRTCELAGSQGAKIYPFAWTGDFAQARNFGLEKASSTWILVLDADETIEPITKESFAILLNEPVVEGYFLHLKNYFSSPNCGNENSYSDFEREKFYSDFVVRLFRNKPEYRFEGSIHEQVAPSILRSNNGKGLKQADLTLNHYGYLDYQLSFKDKFRRNTTILLDQLKESPHDPFLLYALAIEYYRQEQIAEGLVHLQKALRLMTGQEGYFEDTLLNIAVGHFKLNQLEPMLNFIDRALQMFPNHRDLLSLKELGYERLSSADIPNLDRDKKLNEIKKEVKRMEERILVASPIKQNKAILKEFLDSLKQLDTTGLALDFAFVDDGNDHNLLTEFAADKTNVRILAGNKSTSGNQSTSYQKDENTHYWQEELIWKVAGYKNQFIQLARSQGYDFLFLVDSDLYLHPKTLTHLVSLNKDIVSEVYWTRWEPGLRPLPQVWFGDQYRLDEAFLNLISKPGTYKVGGLGGCTLISKKALLAGVSFTEIYNLSLIGEDRHFCVRAAALGFELFADTHYPPFHIYRESELSELDQYKEQILTLNHQISPSSSIAPAKRNSSSSQKGTITLAMLVRNEAGRYLEKVLRHAAHYIDKAVILDDASEDETVEVCKSVLEGIPLTLVSNKEPGFANEVHLRKQLWQMALDSNSDWILILDADELLEDRVLEELPKLIGNSDEIDFYAFRLYDMWEENYYREDPYWQAHQGYRPFLVRNIPGLKAIWQETPQHCGRFPLNITELRGAISELRLKHLGWMKPQDRLQKYFRYKMLDPQAIYGIREQYESILDPRPNLIRWEE